MYLCTTYFSFNRQILVRKLTHSTKGQITPKAWLVRHRFSKKTNKWICFVCCEKQKSKQNKFVCSFFERIYSAPICFCFYLTFSMGSNGLFVIFLDLGILYFCKIYSLLYLRFLDQKTSLWTQHVTDLILVKHLQTKLRPVGLWKWFVQQGK